MKFTVDKLQGSLYKADTDPTKPERLLVQLVADHFQFDFYLRPFEMGAEVVLKALNIEDQIDEDPSPDFKRIITSEGFNEESKEELMHVKFVKVNKASPDYMTVYEAIDTNVDVSISTINVVVTRKTLLTLLDFVVTTFTDPDSPKETVKPSESAVSGGDDVEDSTKKNTSQEPDKIRVKIDLSSIALILNNDGIRLATLSLNSADVGIFLMGKTMRIGARLGNFSLLDDINQGADEESALRQLVTIQGDELADFRYETFDPDAKDTYPGYNSSIYLRSGSIKVNFIEEPFRKIIDFAVKFGKMQALFNAARQVAMNQASQIQENAGQMHFDILVSTPIIVFPRVPHFGRVKRDLITAYLGEIYANNKFLPVDDSKDSLVTNKIDAGIRKVRLTSAFHFENDRSEELEMIDKVDLNFKVDYVEHQEGLERPDIEVSIIALIT